MNLNAFTLGGRKFLLTVISGFGTWILTFNGRITGEVYAAVTIATVGAYIVGNVAQDRLAAKSANEAPTPEEK